jgi:predicted RND superfamily exporter protein
MSAKEILEEIGKVLGLSGASTWAASSLMPEVVHGVITLLIAIGSCIAVFFVNRYLKKKFP